MFGGNAHPIGSGDVEITMGLFLCVWGTLVTSLASGKSRLHCFILLHNESPIFRVLVERSIH